MKLSAPHATISPLIYGQKLPADELGDGIYSCAGSDGEDEGFQEDSMII